MTQVESTSLVFFGKTHDQAQVRLDQLLPSLLTTHVEASLTAPLLRRGAVSDPSPGGTGSSPPGWHRDRLQGSGAIPFLSGRQPISFLCRWLNPPREDLKR